MGVGVIPESGGLLYNVEIGDPSRTGCDGAVWPAIVFGWDICTVPVGSSGLVQLVRDADDHGVAFLETQCGTEHGQAVVRIGIGQG